MELFFILFGASLVAVLFKFLWGLSFAILGISGLLVGMIIFLSIKILTAQKKSEIKKDTFGILLFRYIWIFLKIKLSALIQMLGARATSAGHLAGVVFLKKSGVFPMIEFMKRLLN